MPQTYGSKSKQASTSKKTMDQAKGKLLLLVSILWRIVHRHTIYRCFLEGANGSRFPAVWIININNDSEASLTQSHMVLRNFHYRSLPGKQITRGCIFCTPRDCPIAYQPGPLRFMNSGSGNARHTWMESARHFEWRDDSANPATPQSRVHPLHVQAPGAIVPPRQRPAHRW